MNYAVYNDNGDILYVGFCEDSFRGSLGGPGEHVIETDGTVSDQSHRVENGVLVAKPAHAQFDAERAWEILRRDRNALLTVSDWTQLPDAPADREAWAVYRQALRNITEGLDDPRNVVWPVPPA